MTRRELLVLVRHLPPDSPLGIALHGEAGRWSTTDHLLASTVELLAGANWQRGGGKGSKPKPLPRPDARAEKRRREYVGRLQRLGLIKAGG
ncbi:hypothetical protein MED01_004278 [Micromonospora sp. MED01]|uniref:hypothetical protein n=1 Tax=Micromonospora alfalfae TaxID=2911212 RepID=UPI001EE90FE6|nr:hypothetical protein [Micromonospora alfalfae]MCG5460852.1 hypothetical protein [Micromonospora alfalfae]